MMRLLIDTHIFLWFAADDPKLSAAARKLIAGADEVFVSSASIWEASIKVGLGKLEVNVDELVDAIDACGFNELPVYASHAAGVCELPQYHRDPFDRLLIAQAKSEPLKLMTADALFAQYDPSLIITV
jgi:PIN domain nuclease of toxin-antitoxin system